MVFSLSELVFFGCLAVNKTRHFSFNSLLTDTNIRVSSFLLDNGNNKHRGLRLLVAGFSFYFLSKEREFSWGKFSGTKLV